MPRVLWFTVHKTMSWNWENSILTVVVWRCVLGHCRSDDMPGITHISHDLTSYTDDTTWMQCHALHWTNTNCGESDDWEQRNLRVVYCECCTAHHLGTWRLVIGDIDGAGRWHGRSGTGRWNAVSPGRALGVYSLAVRHSR